jgi:hypothetical protein
MADAGKRSPAMTRRNPRKPWGGGREAGRARALSGRGNTTLVQPERDARKETQSVLLLLHRGSSPPSAAASAATIVALRRRCRKMARWGLNFWGSALGRAGDQSMNRRCQLSNSPLICINAFRPFLLSDTHAQPFLFFKRSLNRLNDYFHLPSSFSFANCTFIMTGTPSENCFNSQVSEGAICLKHDQNSMRRGSSSKSKYHNESNLLDVIHEKSSRFKGTKRKILHIISN